ncbi:MAG: sensor histidine kinase [Aromatoleum sp.]|nr:sensor histidine kinase [Aromatoleum sp.]
MRARRCLLFGLCALLSIARPATSTAADTVLHLPSAEFLLSDSNEPPDADAAWQPQALPDLWADSRPDVKQQSGWYRFRFDLAEQPDQPYAVFITRVRPVGEVFANRNYIGRSGSIARPQNAVYPQYMFIPPAALHAGANELFVRLVGTGAHALTPIAVGEDLAVRPEYERRFFWQVTGVQFCSALALLWGVFSLLLWLRRRDDTIYAYFGLSALCWAIFTSNYFVRFPPVPQPWWEAWVDVGAYGKIMFMTMFALRFAGLDWPRIERGLWCVFALLMGLGLAGDLDLIAGIGNIEWWRPVFAFTIAYVGIFAYTAWRDPKVENVLVTLAASVHLFDGSYQYLLSHPFGHLRLDLYDFLPLNLMLVWILIDRFICALKEAQKLNAELEQRVAQKHAELERNFRQMQQLEQRQAIAEERQRIMSDMHDGIGGQLISTLSMVEQGALSSAEVATVLRECLEDLRLTIDSLEPTDNDLLAVLGNLRYRLDGRLKRCGIRLDWQVKEVPRLACLTPQNVLHILRILQEALTNVLKHADADSVSVETGVDALGAHAYIRVRDNGKGFRGDHAGHGLANMRQRARSVGGKLDITPSPTGTTLELLLPVA